MKPIADPRMVPTTSAPDSELPVGAMIELRGIYWPGVNQQATSRFEGRASLSRFITTPAPRQPQTPPLHRHRGPAGDLSQRTGKSRTHYLFQYPGRRRPCATARTYTRRGATL